jgi:O-antigen ligase
MTQYKMPKLQTRLILVILFLLPVYLIKIKFGWLSFNALELLSGLLIIAWAFNKEKKYFIFPARYLMPIALILVGSLFSVIANKNYYIGFGAIKGWFIFPIIFGIIFYDALRKNKDLLEKSWLALFFSGVAVSLAGAVFKLFGFLTYDGRLRVFYDSPNQLGMFLAPIFIIGCALFLREKIYWRKAIFLAGLLLLASNLYFTYSYGAWIALAIALLITFWLKNGIFSYRSGILILMLLAAIIASQIKTKKIDDLENFSNRSSLSSRLIIWRSAGMMIKNNPLFGIGAGNFQNKYLEYQKYFPPYLEWAVPQPHNLFLAFWLEAGLMGLIGFIFLLIRFFLDNKKAISDNRKMALLCLGIMSYFLIHGLIDTTYWRNDMAFLFWIVVSANYYLATGDTRSA